MQNCFIDVRLSEQNKVYKEEMYEVQQLGILQQLLYNLYKRKHSYRQPFCFFFFWLLFVLCLFAYVMHVYMFSHVRFFVTPMDCKPARLICPCESPGKNTGVHCHFLLQGIFLAQGSNPCLLWFLH